MTSSNTYNYSPSAANIVVNAYAMIQIRRTELTTFQLQDAADAANMLMVDFSNRNPYRWLMETQTVPLTLGGDVYTLTNRTLAIASASVVTTVNGVALNRVIGPISATDYASLPNKAQAGAPGSFFFNLQMTPTISVWPVADAATIAANGVLSLTTFRQMQDVDLTRGATVDAPYRFLDAFTTGLAARLAELYPDALIKSKGPNAIDRLYALYEQRLTLAASRDEERTPMVLSLGLNGYFR